MKKKKIFKNGFAKVILLIMLTFGFTGVYAQQQDGGQAIGDTTQMEQQTLMHDYDTKFDTEVTKEEIPEVVSSAIEEKYSDHEIGKIYRGGEGTYKVELEKGSEKLAAYYSINGELLRVENNEDSGKND